MYFESGVSTNSTTLALLKLFVRCQITVRLHFMSFKQTLQFFASQFHL